MTGPPIRAPLRGTSARRAATCAPVSDFTGAIHGYHGDTGTSGSPAPPRPANRAVKHT